MSLQPRTKQWEFDSHLEITFQGKSRLVQIWSCPSPDWGDTRAWTKTENTPGKENPPKPGQGYWTSTEAFKKQFTNFIR